MARYLLRNGSLISIEVETGLLDVLIYRDFSGEFVCPTFSEQAEFALLNLGKYRDNYVLKSPFL